MLLSYFLEASIPANCTGSPPGLHNNRGGALVLVAKSVFPEDEWHPVKGVRGLPPWKCFEPRTQFGAIWSPQKDFLARLLGVQEHVFFAE